MSYVNLFLREKALGVYQSRFKKKASLINVHSFIAEVKLRGGGGPEGEVVPDPPPQEAT